MIKRKKLGQFSVLAIWSVSYRGDTRRERFSLYCAETLSAKDSRHAKKKVKQTLKDEFRKFRKKEPSASVLGKHYSIFELSAEILKKQAKAARPRSMIQK